MAQNPPAVTAKAPELRASAGVGVVFDVHQGLTLVHHEVNKKEEIEITVYLENGESDKPTFKFDRLKITWQDFVQGIRDRLNIDFQSSILVQSRVGQPITEAQLKKLRPGPYSVAVTGKENRASGTTRVQSNFERSRQLDSTYRSEEWNAIPPELTELQLLQAEWQYLPSHNVSKKFMLGYALDQRTYEGELTPKLRGILKGVEAGSNSKLDQQHLKQVQVELEAAQISAEQALEDTQDFRKEVASSRAAFIMAFFENVFVVNHLLPWLDPEERVVFMSCGKQIKATTLNVVNWGTNKIEEQEEVDRLVQDEYGRLCRALANGMSSIEAAAGEAKRAQWHAAQQNNADVLRWLLDTGISLELTDHLGCTALHIAALGDCVECARLLVEAKAPIDRRDSFGRSPLWLCADRGMAGVAASLLEEAADANLPDQRRRTPLWIASRNGSTEVVSLLVAHRADAESPGDHSLTPLMAAAYYGHKGVCEALVKYGVDLEAKCHGDGNTAYQWAMMNKREDCAKILQPKKWGLVYALRSQGHKGNMEVALGKHSNDDGGDGDGEDGGSGGENLDKGGLPLTS